jgi:hypothetical protein
LVVADIFNTEYPRVGGSSNKISSGRTFVTGDVRSIVLGTVLSDFYSMTIFRQDDKMEIAADGACNGCNNTVSSRGQLWHGYIILYAFPNERATVVSPPTTLCHAGNNGVHGL